MKQEEIRKLKIELPILPIVDDKPWAIAGWFLVIAFLIMAGCAFLKFKEVL